MLSVSALGGKVFICKEDKRSPGTMTMDRQEVPKSIFVGCMVAWLRNELGFENLSKLNTIFFKEDDKTVAEFKLLVDEHGKELSAAIVKPKKNVNDDLRHQVINILIGGGDTHAKADLIMKLFEQFSPSGIVVGWLQVRVKAPKVNEYINIKYKDGTEAFERLLTRDLLIELRQKDAFWQPFNQ